jgi:hypothetical protein
MEELKCEEVLKSMIQESASATKRNQRTKRDRS